MAKSRLEEHNELYLGLETLQSSCIRILSLLPRPAASEIDCHLHIIQFPTVTNYEALSYVWGSQSKPTHIFCNGFKKAVSANLHAALVRLRDTDSVRRLWVDAVCINQADARERSLQVSLMRDIYQRAERVVVWLGQEGGELAAANDTAVEWAVRSLSQSTPNAGFAQVYRSWLSPSIRQNVTSQELYRSLIAMLAPAGIQSNEGARVQSSKVDEGYIRWLGTNAPFLHDPNAAAFSALQMLFERSWFSRKWTFQEIILAGKAIVCCGSSEMVWDDLVDWFNALNGPHGLQDLIDQKQTGLLALSSVQQTYRKGLTRLSHLLLITRHRECFEPLDHIYSLLGLVSSKYAAIQPDYSRDRTQVFIDVARCCVDVEKELTILSAAGYRTNNIRLPGWVPDWTRASPRRCLPAQEDGTKSNFCAALNTAAQIGPLSTGLALQLRGFVLGVLGPVSVGAHTLLTDHDRIRNALVMRAGGKSYGEGGSALPRTLHEHPQFPHDRIERGVTFGSLQVPGILKGRVISPLPEDITKLKTLAEYDTDDLPVWATQGDWVCILLGGPVCYVLRSRDRTHPESFETMHESTDCHFIGECYTPGFMHGQAMSLVTRKDFRYIDFVLY